MVVIAVVVAAGIEVVRTAGTSEVENLEAPGIDLAHCSSSLLARVAPWLKETSCVLDEIRTKARSRDECATVKYAAKKKFLQNRSTIEKKREM